MCSKFVGNKQHISQTVILVYRCMCSKFVGNKQRMDVRLRCKQVVCVLSW